MKAPARTYTMRARAEAVEATRERIARAAMQRFLTEPYDDVTIASVARDAGVSHQTLLNHFESKDGLFAAAAERFSADPAERRRTLAALHAATDVYTWKLLRRDLGHGRRATQRIMTDMVGAILSTTGKEA